MNSWEQSIAQDFDQFTKLLRIGVNSASFIDAKCLCVREQSIMETSKTWYWPCRNLINVGNVRGYE